MRALLGLQSDGGIWDYTTDDPYRTYHATMCGAQALLAHKFRGFGPGISEILPNLVTWVDEDLKNSDSFKSQVERKKAEIVKKNSIIRQQRQKEYNFSLNSYAIAATGSQDINYPSDMTAHVEERYFLSLEDLTC